MPLLVKMAAEHESKGVKVLCVTDANVADTVRFLNDESLPFPVLADATAVREAFGIGMVWGSPAFLLDRDGKVVAEELSGVERFLAKLAATEG